MKMNVSAHEPLEELAKKIPLKKYASIRDRLRAVVQARQGQSAAAIARALGRHRRWVQEWVYRYRDDGLAGLCDRPRKGQPTKLPRKHEAAFRARIEARATREDGVCRLGGREIRHILAREFETDYSLNGTYQLLHRLGYACLRPRPKHRKSDPVAQEAFKQAFPLLSKP
jgi:transposase